MIICFVKDVFDSWKQFSKSQVQLLTFGKTKVLKICISNTTNSLALLGPDSNLFYDTSKSFFQDQVTSPSGLIFQPSHSIEDLKRFFLLHCDNHKGLSPQDGRSLLPGHSWWASRDAKSNSNSTDTNLAAEN